MVLLHCGKGHAQAHGHTSRRTILAPAGNLCWGAAMEFEVASRSVHSTVLDAKGKADPQGDDKFRSAFMDIAKRFMAQVGREDASSQ